ncbi:hypothetical protein [Staphylococcus pseudintermedius]|uniref:hypothetical protein n=1 Tax=Staphylococcus pseudintermedius TaxID=283734 RepID=UPI001BDEEA80|nr:hypothetical protein [Staphylococcus pseudintermedius]EJD5747161.1 hypothetical protein [Staphylococcus pseudintermedius]
MNNKVHYFEANGYDYKLKITKDLFGCEGVGVIENGEYIGMIDCADERDFKRIEGYIKQDKDFVRSDEVYC